MTDLAQKVLELADAEDGEHEVPPNSNRGPRIDGYAADLGLDPAYGYKWCAIFVSSMIKRAAEALPTPKRFRSSASCHRLVDLNMDLALSAPEDGCVFVHLDTDRVRAHDHCGFVRKVLAGGILDTREGNANKAGSRDGGSVCENARPKGYATHYIAIK